MSDYERHPLSALWGDIPEAEFAEMVEEFRRSPTRQMITLYEDKILDGWHRYRMCLDVGIEPFFSPLPEGQDPVTFVITRNAHRRHLTQMQYRVGILLSHGIRGAGEYDRGKGIDSIPLPPTIQQHIESFGGSRPGWLNALAIVKAGYGPQVMAGEPAQPFLDLIHETRIEKNDDISTDSQPGESLTPGSEAEEETGGGGTNSIYTGDDRGHRPTAGESETTQPDVGPERDGPGIEPPTEKPPSPKQRLEAQIEVLQLEISERVERIEALESETEFLRGEGSEYSHEREAKFRQQDAIINALRASVATAEQKYQDERRSRLYWERQAKQLGWQPRTQEQQS